ncbi:MAG: rhomboid family intramembrane serine protease [Candidatus Limnocylindrales bacterium]
MPAGTDPTRPGPLDRSTATAFLRQAEGLANAGEYAKAAQAYSRIVGSGDPDIHTAALLGLADARYRLDDEAGAQETWEAATQAPENSFSWLAWKQLAAARVRAGAIRPAIDAYREAERRAPADQRAEIDSRLGWLYKESGETGRARGYFSRARGTDFTPWVTYAVIAITVGIGLAQIALTAQPATPPAQPPPCGATDPLTQLFCLDKGLVAQGQVYRLLSVVLVHAGFVHLAFNMYALLIVGPLVEQLFGHWIWIVMYLITAAAASVLSYVLLPGADAVGASGAIFGLFGVLGTSLWFYRPMVPQARGIARQIAFLVVLNLVLDVAVDVGGQNIDIFAHIGGLLAGVWLGLAIPPRGVTTMAGAFRRPGQAPGPNPGLPAFLQVVAVLALVAVIGLGLLVGTAIQVA